MLYGKRQKTGFDQKETFVFLNLVENGKTPTVSLHYVQDICTQYRIYGSEMEVYRGIRDGGVSKVSEVHLNIFP